MNKGLRAKVDETMAELLTGLDERLLEQCRTSLRAQGDQLFAAFREEEGMSEAQCVIGLIMMLGVMLNENVPALKNASPYIALAMAWEMAK